MLSSPLQPVLTSPLQPVVGGIRRAFGTPNNVTPTRFVDSVNGLDANDGNSILTAKQTLSGIGTLSSSAVLGLARGSSWKEQKDILVSNVTVGPYGSGNVPVIDGADVVTGWTQPDAVTYPNVWSVSWTRAWTPSATELLFMWWDGALPPRYASSLADLQANGGWWTSARTSLTATVYIKSTTNPNSNGVLYELPKRKYGIGNHPTAIGGTQTNMQLEGPLEAKRHIGHYGGFNSTTGDVSRLLIRGGSIHHIVTAADTAQDIICAEMPIGYTSEYIPYTAYYDNSSGRTHTAKRIFVIGDTSATNNGGMYTHGSTAPFDNAIWEQCHPYLTNRGVQASVTNSLTVRGMYSRQVTFPVTMGGTSTSVQHSVFRDTSATFAGTGVADSGPVDTTSRTRVVEHCVFYGSGSFGPNIGVDTRNGSLTVRYCIFILPAGEKPIYTVAATSLNIDVHHCIFICTGTPPLYSPTKMAPGSGTLSMDYNAYCYPAGSDSSKLRYDDAAGSVTSLASWKTRSGQDAHSIEIVNRPTLLADIFSGDITAGDFRLKSTHGITFTDGQSLNIAGPQEHWDWNARAAVSGAPTAWPVIPSTLTQMRSYIANPSGWTF